MNVMSLFSPNGPDVVVLSQNKAASYIYQNNYRNHTGIYQPSAVAHREDTAKTFLFRGIKKSEWKIESGEKCEKEAVKGHNFSFRTRLATLDFSLTHFCSLMLTCF